MSINLGIIVLRAIKLYVRIEIRSTYNNAKADGI
jgi:hypothetical protein